MVSVDHITQAAIESIGIEDDEYEECWSRANSTPFEDRTVCNIETVRVEPGIQGRPMPVITGTIDEERVWWDPAEDEWIRKPTYD